LRRSHNSGNFSPQSMDLAAYSGGNTNDFPQRVHILAAYGAKLAATRSN
jgi:hypothetical protein